MPHMQRGGADRALNTVFDDADCPADDILIFSCPIEIFEFGLSSFGTRYRKVARHLS